MSQLQQISPKRKKAYESIGQRFGMVVVSDVIGSKQGNCIVSYKCDCGNFGKIAIYALKSGHTKSCGCKHTTHGDSESPLYNVWRSIKNRTTKPNSKSYSNYGGRGIGICEEWLDYKSFRKWATESGYKKGVTVERKNNNKGYSPDNCIVATYKEQNNNRRDNVILNINGQSKTISQWASFYGLRYRVLWDRVNRKWPVDRLFIKPRKSPTKK